MEEVKEFFYKYGRTCFYNAKEIAKRMGITQEQAERGIEKLLEMEAIHQSGTWDNLPAYRIKSRHEIWKR